MLKNLVLATQPLDYRVVLIKFVIKYALKKEFR